MCLHCLNQTFTIFKCKFSFIEYTVVCLFRHAHWAGISQYVAVEPGKSYHFSARVKVLNQQPGTLWDTVDFILELQYSDGLY